MKIGVYFEHFVIIIPSFYRGFYRDYQTEYGNTDFTNSMSFVVGMHFLQGIIITLLTLGIFEITKRKKTMHNSVNKN
jgi:hypothetical protein